MRSNRLVQKGTQSIQRTIALLRAVAQKNDQGVRLSQLARKVGLHVATVRRILTVLAEEGLITYDPASKLYRLGLELYVLGSAAKQFAIREWFHDILKRIAQETEDTVYLITRSGNDALCIDRVEGKFPIRIMTYDIGARHPLGVGTAGLTYLAFLPDDEAEKILYANKSRYGKYNNMNEQKIRSLTALTRKRGYTINEGNYLKGVTGVGFPILNQQGEVIAAISVAAISERMGRRRQLSIVRLLKSEIALMKNILPN
jgi:DNA-binding IclR family transcriptional regulator